MLQNLKMKPKTLRKIHSYLSLLFCVLLCFYLITGFFLNHPTWFEQEPHISITQQKISPANSLQNILNDQQLQLPEHLMDELESSSELELSTPGRRKIITIEEYVLETETIHYGLIATLNDLHKNRHVNIVWTIVADVFIFFTLIMCFTGIWISLKNLKKKNQNITTLSIGGLILLLFIVLMPTAYSAEADAGDAGDAGDAVQLEAMIDIRTFDKKTENPYLAVFSKSKGGEYRTHFVLRDRYKWVKDLKTYWRKIARENREIVDAHSGATRKAGLFKKQFELELLAGETLGDVVFYLETAREKGSREVVVLEALPGTEQVCVLGNKEISKFCLQRMK